MMHYIQADQIGVAGFPANLISSNRMIIMSRLVCRIKSDDGKDRIIY